MPFELLDHFPISGTVLERHFSVVSGGRNVWVRFENAEGDEWVGVFGGHGWSQLAAVAPFGDDDGRTVLVVAGGQGYVVDSVNGTLLRRTPWKDAAVLASPPGRDFVLVSGGYSFWAAYRDRDVQAVQNIPESYHIWDFKLCRSGEDTATGIAWDGSGSFVFQFHHDQMLTDPDLLLLDVENVALVAALLPVDVADAAPSPVVVGHLL